MSQFINNKNDSELDINKQHREDYEKLMKDASSQHEGYWDSNNPFVRILLFVLLVIIVVGSVYYILTYYNTMN